MTVVRLWAILFVAMSAAIVIIDAARGRTEPLRLLVHLGGVLVMSGVIAYIARSSRKRQ